jgi:hypothetical protein
MPDGEVGNAVGPGHLAGGMWMGNRNACREARPLVEAMESRLLASVSPKLMGQITFPTRTELTVEAGTLCQPITFHVKVFAGIEPSNPIDLHYRGKVFKEIRPGLVDITPTHPLVYEGEATYMIPAGIGGGAKMG